MLLALVLAASAGLVAPHLFHPLWQDEVKTLELFSRGGFWHPFQVYPFPNNHVLSSALLAVWGDLAGGAEAGVAWLRGLPAAMFLAAAGLLAVATSRIGGGRAGILAAALFASSHVSLSFASELRGYGLSWLPVVVAFASVPGLLERGGVSRAAAYAIATAASVAILPTNLLLVAVFGAWALATSWAEGHLGDPERRRRLAFLFLAPLSGGLAYVSIWRQLLANAGRDLGSWTLVSIAGHWLWATLVDFAWLVPVMLWGAVVVRRTIRAGAVDAGPARATAIFCACVAIVPALAFVLLPNIPYARNLVPVLPLWYAALALLFDAAWATAWRRAPRFELLGFGVLVALLFGIAGFREAAGAGYVDRYPGRRHALVQDLYDQYYHHEYRPAEIAEGVLARMRTHPSALFLTDHNGLWVIGSEVERRAGRASRSRLVHFRDGSLQLRERSNDAPIFLVGHSVERAREMTRLHGLPEARAADLVETSGFFAIFESGAEKSGGASKR